MGVKNELDKVDAQLSVIEAKLQAGMTTAQLVGFMSVLATALQNSRDLVTLMRTRSRNLMQSVVVTGAPVPPIDLTGELIQSPTSFDLAWTTGAGGSIEGHRIQRSVDGGDFEQVGLDIATPTVVYSDDTIEENHTYVYRVVAYNASDDSLPADNTVTITT